MSFTCPRRRETGMDRESPLVGSGPDRDEWQNRHGMAGSPKLPLCSWCGSLKPEEFMAGLRLDRYFVGPTDKAYKIYVHADDDQTVQYDPDGPAFPNGPTIAKFYTPHFREDQAWEFHQMLRAGWLKFGYPGHFYSKIFLPGVLERLRAEQARQ